MQWMMLFLLASDPLPKELAYQLDQVRMVPAPISGALIVELAGKAKISAEQKRELAEEAYGIAQASLRREVVAYAGKSGIDLERGVAQLWIADPTAVVAAAFMLYRENWSEALTKDGKRMRLSFPSKPEWRACTCETMLVGDPKGYFEKAALAGPREFRNAVQGIRSSVELGRALEAGMRAGGEAMGAALGQLHGAFYRLKDSDREFHYAMRRTQLHNIVMQAAEQLEESQSLVFLSQYRSYLLRHFGGERCVEHADETWKGVIAEFNAAAAGRKGLEIAEEAGRAQKLAAKGKEELLLFDAAGARLYVDSGTLVGEETELTAFLTKLEEWKAEGYDPRTAGIARVLLYGRALDRLQSHVFVGRVVASFLKYLTYSPLRVEMPAYWLASVEKLAGWADRNQQRKQFLEYSGDAGITAVLKAGVLWQGLDAQ